MGIVDSGLDALIQEYGPEIDRKIDETLSKARESNTSIFDFYMRAAWLNLLIAGSYYQKWKPTREHTFPTDLSQLPPGAQEIKRRWREFAPQGSTFFGAYLKTLAIETNHVESTFLLTDGVHALLLDYICYI